jgi:uncharacterized protein (DUF2384 family)
MPKRADNQAEIIKMAEKVFGSAEVAKRWLKTNNLALGKAPVEFLHSDDGVQEVKKVLNAIAYGGVV